MSPRFAPVLVAVIAASVAAGCVAAEPPTRVLVPPPSSVSEAPPSTSPGTTPAPSPSPATGAVEPTAIPEEGNVEDLPMGPVLSVESSGKRSIIVTLDDLDAKAWRIIVAGIGDYADDRLTVTVETGDVAPVITLVETQAGRVVDSTNLSGFGDPTTTAGRCHPSLGVCVDADGIRLPVNGDGRLSIELARSDGTSLVVTGETAGWPGEPFILGTWTPTEPFPWEAGVSF